MFIQFQYGLQRHSTSKRSSKLFVLAISFTLSVDNDIPPTTLRFSKHFLRTFLKFSLLNTSKMLSTNCEKEESIVLELLEPVVVIFSSAGPGLSPRMDYYYIISDT